MTINTSRECMELPSSEDFLAADRLLALANSSGVEVCDPRNPPASNKTSIEASYDELHWDESFTFADCFDSDASLVEFVDAENAAEVARMEKESAVVAVLEKELNQNATFSSLVFHETLVCPWESCRDDKRLGGVRDEWCATTQKPSRSRGKKYKKTLMDDDVELLSKENKRNHIHYSL